MSKYRSLVVGALALILITAWLGFTSGRGAPTSASAAVPAGATIPWGGGAWNLHGVNMAWYNWACDFGCGTSGGVSGTKAQIAPRFAQLQANGIHNVRWWMFEDASQIERDASGAPTRIKPSVYGDIDAALALASQYDLYYTFVIFNFPGDIPRSWLDNATQRQQLADVLAPMFARYAGNARVLSWEVFNEPEWDMWNNKVNSANTQAFVRAVVNAVHANSPALATVGSAHLDGLTFWKGMGLDYYQAHWYDYMQPGNWCARCRDYASVKAQYGIDAPLVIGEFYAGPDTDALQRYEDFFAKGYAGAWAWSLFPEKTQDRLAVDLNAAGTFASRHANAIGPRAGAGGSPGTPKSPLPIAPTMIALLPPATATATPTSPTAPVATATATSTATPATPAAPPVGNVTRWQTAAVVSPGIVRGGSAVSVNANAVGPATGSFLVDVEIYSPSGQKVYQKWFDRTAFTSGQAKSFNVPWTVPANAEKGTWTVKIGVFTPNWASLADWNNGAATFTVQ